MFCDEALDAVEAIAAGDLIADGRVAAHLASCPNCALALESARQLERSLRLRAVPAPSAQFTARTITRVRRAQWRSDQFLDVGFNVAIGLVAIAVVAGVWMLLHRTGLEVVGSDAVTLFGTGFATFARRIVPFLPRYAGAAALLATALGIWWWAEKDAPL
jgi:hypothetical protein